MGRPKRDSRIYRRGSRYYGDFRDLGGQREALKAEGESWATTDPDVAAKLAADRVRVLEEQRRNRGLGLPTKKATLKPYAARHLRKKAEDEEIVDSWLSQSQRHLKVATEFFGTDVDLRAITPDDLSRYVGHLRRLDNGRGGRFSDTSVRKYLNTMSNMYARAVSEGYADRNPVADMYKKPTEHRVEPDHLKPEEAALLLESARTYQASTGMVEQGHGGKLSAHANPHMYPILATFLLTGGRKSEVLGLEIDDVSFRLGRVYFRTNEWRRLKTRGSKRSVPLWPQLEEILRQYMQEREREGGLGKLLFPSVGGRPRDHGDEEGESGERMIRDLRRALDAIGERAGFPEGHVRLHMLRHTYTAARIQTLDRGASVALYTVARELGHRSTDMIEDRYGHLHDRAVLGGSEVVEFSIEHHEDTEGIRDRLVALRSG